MRRIRAKPAQRGYAMVLVIVFMLLLLSLIGLTFRQVASVLRVETARSKLILRDEGSMQAAAQALASLENGPPPSDPFVVTLAVSTSAGLRSYQVTYASDPGVGNWSVNVIPAPAGP